MEFFFPILFGTFVLEDVALASSLALVANGKMTLVTAFFACFIGISIGDLGLYLLGRGTSRFEKIGQVKLFRKYETSLTGLKHSRVLSYSIVASRVIPGTRIPTYFSAGLLRYPLLQFLALTLGSVFLWVLVALETGHRLGLVLRGNWAIALFTFLVLLSILKSLILKVVDPWKRKALLHSWRKWLHFEFWPAWLFYLPVVPYYVYQAIRGKSFLLPFYANPKIQNGGLIGESKFDFLKHLSSSDPTTLESVFLEGGLSSDQVSITIEKNNLSYPFILKPDVGQRGYGVRIIRSKPDLNSYLGHSRGASLVAQRLSLYPNEAGIFYYRMPSEESGSVFSITDKQFPSILSDGRRRLGDLILNDPRARIIAPVYFSRHRENLSKIFPEATEIVLSECGNHCQGAIFKNGSALSSSALTRKIDSIAKTIPDFYFGRFDVKYKNADQLKQGLDFEIVEVNGAGSEATHIWDCDTKLLEAYGVLFEQWAILFKIGAEIKKQNRPGSNIKLWRFLNECFHVIRRNDKLSVSS